jgi:hypothetical protein
VAGSEGASTTLSALSAIQCFLDLTGSVISIRSICPLTLPVTHTPPSLHLPPDTHRWCGCPPLSWGVQLLRQPLTMGAQR